MHLPMSDVSCNFEKRCWHTSDRKNDQKSKERRRYNHHSHIQRICTQHGHHVRDGSRVGERDGTPHCGNFESISLFSLRRRSSRCAGILLCASMENQSRLPTHVGDHHLCGFAAERGGHRNSFDEPVGAECRRGKFHALVACVTSENPKSATFHQHMGFSKVTCFKEVGMKFGRRVDVSDFELILE